MKNGIIRDFFRELTCHIDIGKRYRIGIDFCPGCFHLVVAFLQESVRAFYGISRGIMVEKPFFVGLENVFQFTEMIAKFAIGTYTPHFLRKCFHIGAGNLTDMNQQVNVIDATSSLGLRTQQG